MLGFGVAKIPLIAFEIVDVFVGRLGFLNHFERDAFACGVTDVWFFGEDFTSLRLVH